MPFYFLDNNLNFMDFFSPTSNIYWTSHSHAKLRQYRLSESRVKRILRHPRRLEVGIAPDTVAGMQPAGSKKHPNEIWVMWAVDKFSKVNGNTKFNLNRKIRIISVWRYPGTSPAHEPPPIPQDVWELINKKEGNNI